MSLTQSTLHMTDEKETEMIECNLSLVAWGLQRTCATDNKDLLSHREHRRRLGSSHLSLWARLMAIVINNWTLWKNTHSFGKTMRSCGSVVKFSVFVLTVPPNQPPGRIYVSLINWTWNNISWEPERTSINFIDLCLSDYSCVIFGCVLLAGAADQKSHTYILMRNSEAAFLHSPWQWEVGALINKVYFLRLSILYSSFSLTARFPKNNEEFRICRLFSGPDRRGEDLSVRSQPVWN